MRYECENCGHIGDEDDFPMVRDLEQRLDENGPYTDKECPECGALAYAVDPAAFEPVLRTSREEIADALKSKGEDALAQTVLDCSNSDFDVVVRKIGDRFTDLLGESYLDVLAAEAGSYFEVEVG